MKRFLLEGLRCPACHGSLRLGDAAELGGLVLRGTLKCPACFRNYPVREGAAYLGVLDDAWGTILKELINRREIIERDLLQESATHQRKEEQDRSANELADVCFREALKRLPGDRPLRLLDCGAGMFETTAEFAGLGIDAVATETEISMVRHANFEHEGRGDPQPFEINGREYHIRDPKGHPHYFSRVVCDIQRLPFADGFFDVTFCRAMLHHVDDPRHAVREMARVTRPGGVVIVCAEPARGILDREEDFHEDTVDRAEGMNEQVPTLRAYRQPLAALSEQVSVQYWPFPPAGRWKSLCRLYNFHRHLWPGEELTNWKWRKLLPVASAVNLYARRSDAPPPPFPPPVKEDAETIEEIARVYLDFDGKKSVEGLREGTEQLKALRRKLLAARAGRYPARVEPGRTRGLVLESGWARIERTTTGETFRHTLRRASVVLRVPRGAYAVEIDFAAGRDDMACRFAVRLNGSPPHHLAAESSAWNTQAIPLPSATVGVVQVEFETATPTHHDGLDTPVGPAVRMIRVV